MNQDLAAFVKEALREGASHESVRTVLIQAGWEKIEVEAALSGFTEIPFAVPVPRPRPYLSAREAFMYLVMFLTLYITAFSAGSVLFQFINLRLPLPADLGFGYDYGSRQTIRQATAALIVALPVFVLTQWIIARADGRAERRTSRVRKWLTYLTLFIGATVIIGTLITLVSNLLSGDLTRRFILKIIVTLSITGIIFGYYLWDLRTDEQVKRV